MKHSLKEKIIDLLQHTNNDKLLEQVYSILDSAINSSKGEIWNGLKEEDRKETLLSVKEAADPYNIINHEDAMKEIRTKLGWT
jgi:hypothetical protein